MLLDAIAALRADASAKGPPPALTSAPRFTAVATAVPAPEAVGERRHVTVMFRDLVDSTGIAAKLDAEEWRDLVGAYLEAASAAETEMGGPVAKKLGRRVDGAVRLPGGAGERCRACSAGGARNSAIVPRLGLPIL